MRNYQHSQLPLNKQPTARALISGNTDHPQIHGMVSFSQTLFGVLIKVDIAGLPNDPDSPECNIFGFDISKCSANSNTSQQVSSSTADERSYARILPFLLGNHGYVLMQFLTDRFSVSDIIGFTVFIEQYMDVRVPSKPTERSARRVACGVIDYVPGSYCAGY